MTHKDRARLGLTVFLLLLPLAIAGCPRQKSADDPDAALTDAGPDAAIMCGPGVGCPLFTECATDGVYEIQLEPGELGTCTPTSDILGRGNPAWPWEAGGRPLADRLCVAQGLSTARSAGATAVRRQQAELIADAGIRMIRIDFRWSRIEPSPGSFNFSGYDEMVAAADASQIEVLALLDYGNPWATSLTDSDDKYPPDDPEDFAAYVTEVALRYAGRIDTYEIWNEQNGGYRFWKPSVHGDADAFGALMTRAASALRSVCADCTIVSGGLFFHEQVINGALEFTHDMLTAHPDAFADIDRFGFHPYPIYPPTEAPERSTSWGERSMGAMVADLQALLAQHGVGSLPFAVTEVGWPVSGSVDETVQARFLARSTLLGVSLGMDPYCWYNLADGPNFAGFPPEDAFGLFHYGSEVPGAVISPKPGARAFGWLGTIGVDAIPAGPSTTISWHDPDAGRFALDFDAPGGRWTAVWSLQSENADFIGETRSGYDLFGGLVAAPAGGTLQLSLGPSVVYLLP